MESAVNHPNSLNVEFDTPNCKAGGFEVGMVRVGPRVTLEH